MRIELIVPFKDKNKAKYLGAKWDIINKVWYVIDPINLRDFNQWMSVEVQNWYKNNA